MKDWLAELDKFSQNYGKGVLQDAGSVTHAEAVGKAESEYDKYKKLTADELTPIEREYLETLKDVQQRVEKKGKRAK